MFEGENPKIDGAKAFQNVENRAKDTKDDSRPGDKGQENHVSKTKHFQYQYAKRL